jgi:hypothetical protein
MAAPSKKFYDIMPNVKKKDLLESPNISAL